MIHTKQGMPSKSWLVAYLKRYGNKRVSFHLKPGTEWWNILVRDGAFNKTDPIVVSGIFCGLMKRPEDWPNLYAQGPTKLYLSFRGLFFRQGDSWCRHPLAFSYKDNKRQETEFELSEMLGLRIADAIYAMVPRLGQTPGKYDYSERSSAKGSLSKKELPPLPRGSNSLEE